MKAAVIALLGLGALTFGLVLLPGGQPAAAPRPVATDAPEKDSARPEPRTGADYSASDGRQRAVASTKSPALPRGAAADDAGASPRDREQRMNQLAMRLAALPADEMLARVAQLPDQESRDMAMLALLGEMSGQSSLEIIRGGDVWRFGAGGALAVHLLESGKITPSEAVAIAQANTDGNRRGDLLVRIGSKLAAADPAAAVALGNDLGGWERQRFLEDLAGNWAASSPEGARRWIAGVTDVRTRDALVTGLLQAETRANPSAAAAAFASLAPADSSARGRAAMRIASEWASKDTLAAMQWAETLPDENDRRAAGQGIRSAAPVGIGAMLTRGSEGLPVIGNLVPGGPASTSGVLQSGDTLLAVSDSNGGWVDTRGLSQRELLGLVRGEPNTQVSLQVRSPGSSAPRVVTLGRQQLIFRPQP